MHFDSVVFMNATGYAGHGSEKQSSWLHHGMKLWTMNTKFIHLLGGRGGNKYGTEDAVEPQAQAQAWKDLGVGKGRWGSI